MVYCDRKHAGQELAMTLKKYKDNSAAIVIALPHGAKDSLEALGRDVDELVVIDRPIWYGSVGQYHADFPQVNDEGVVKLMEHSTNRSK